MKYAMGETLVITQRKGREEAERKLKNVTREKEDLTAKIKTLTGEKTKIQHLADSRVTETTTITKNIKFTVLKGLKESLMILVLKSCYASTLNSL